MGQIIFFFYVPLFLNNVPLNNKTWKIPTFRGVRKHTGNLPAASISRLSAWIGHTPPEPTGGKQQHLVKLMKLALASFIWKPLVPF